MRCGIGKSYININYRSAIIVFHHSDTSACSKSSCSRECILSAGLAATLTRMSLFTPAPARSAVTRHSSTFPAGGLPSVLSIKLTKTTFVNMAMPGLAAAARMLMVGLQTFPEDEIRCQAVLQAWDRQHCLCMYANRIFRIRRDDKAWEEDLYECRKFLQRRGY